MKSRPEKTLADYVAIALGPVLIMLLVGSLVFFLLEVSYSGQWEDRLRWILFWFVFASVLVSRIAIEQGSEQAALYGLALAAATALVVFKFVDFVVGALCLLGVVWWCVNKLTWDCTLIDEDEDASGEGLLQVAGLDESSAGNDQNDAPQSPRSAGRPHPPGLWVVYFSLAALPLFGVGQLLIPDEAGRRYGFQLLWVYVAAGLGLLLSTSFLGLRRYLRGRNLQMPAAMTGTWLVMGVVLIAVILLLCILLPRPEADYSITALLDKIESEDREASRVALLHDDAGKGEGQRSGKADQDNQQQDEAAEQDRAVGKNGDEGRGNSKREGQQDGGGKGQSKRQGEQAGGDKGQKKREDEKRGDGQRDGQGKRNDGSKRAEKRQGEEDGGRQQEAAKDQPVDRPESGSPEPSFSDPGSWLAKLAKWIVYGVFALVVLFLVIRNWPRLVAALGRLFQDLLNLWNGLWGRNRAEGDETDGEVATESSPPRPFAAFDNPFVTGAADRMGPAEVVVYTFEAIEAWASEQGWPRRPEQTPMEFARFLGSKVSAFSNDVQQVAQLYARVAYAGQSPSRQGLDILERFWRLLSTPEIGTRDVVTFQ